MNYHEQSADFRRVLQESARLLQHNRPAEAVEKLTPLYERLPAHPDVAINLGGAYILLRKWNRAVRVLRHAAESHPENAMLWTNLAAAELGRLETAGPQQMAQALAAYEQALAADPQVPNVHYQMALIYKEQGALQQAIASFQLALAVNPADRDARYWLERLSQHQLYLSGQSGLEQVIEQNMDQGDGDQSNSNQNNGVDE